MAGGPRFVRRRQATEGVVAVVERALVLVSDGPPGAALVGGLGDDLLLFSLPQRYLCIERTFEQGLEVERN